MSGCGYDKTGSPKRVPDARAGDLRRGAGHVRPLRKRQRSRTGLRLLEEQEQRTTASPVLIGAPVVPDAR